MEGVSDLYRLFIVQMHTYAVSKNKTLRVWEGFGPQSGQGGHKPVNASTVAVPTAGISVSVIPQAICRCVRTISVFFSDRLLAIAVVRWRVLFTGSD